MKRLVWTAAVFAALAVGIAVSGCGGDEPDDSAGTAASNTVRVGFVSDTAGIEDGGFNELGAAGLARAGRELGVETRVIASAREGDYEANLDSLAENGYDLVIASGFNLIDALAAVSARHPDTDFAIVDIPFSQVPGAGENVVGLPFDQEPAGQLAGYLAGLMVEAEVAGAAGEGGAKVGVIGGQEIPPVASWIEGFRTGLAEASPGTRVLEEYSGTFGKPARCKRIARRQIEAGATVIFEAAARCGVAAIQEAGRHGALAIGTDGEYLGLGPHVLASGLKRTDVAVFETVEAYVDGGFEGGGDRLFTIEDGAVGLSELGEAVPGDVARRVNRRASDLASVD